jgi:UDP-N-acetylmuramoyl-L-alanyl-D-glutamate--2,6-diaminopimelate ligase
MRPSSIFSHTLDEIAEFLKIQSVSGEIRVTGVTSNSKDVRPGDLFVALPGARVHGLDFASQAIELGAVAILSDRKISEQSIPTLVVKDPRAHLGVLASWFYGEPTRNLSVYGITGTNGKTTTTHLLFQIWQSAGISSGLIGTVGVRIGKEQFPAIHTTPEADELQSTFATMFEKGARFIAMEVSSHALVQDRVSGTRFRASGFTNLTQDHLDFHTTMENYFQAKRLLFQRSLSDRAFITIDDDYGKRLAREVASEFDIAPITLTASKSNGDWRYQSIDRLAAGYELIIAGPHNISISGRFNLVGEHNLQNLLLAVALASDSGVSPQEIENAMPHLSGAPGRLEKVDCGQTFTVLVDYAHTPDAVDRVLTTLRSISTGRVIAILGCGGDRDKSKRPLMGASLNFHSDIPIFTSDNPRSEDPMKIIDEMTSGLQLKTHAEIIVNRKDAIAKAISLAEPRDVVIVLGKGHESGQEIKGVKYPFSDQEVLREALAGLK